MPTPGKAEDGRQGERAEERVLSPEDGRGQEDGGIEPEGKGALAARLPAGAAIEKDRDGDAAEERTEVDGRVEQGPVRHLRPQRAVELPRPHSTMRLPGG